MKIRVFNTSKETLGNKNTFTIVIDVLRATSSIINAFINGALSVYPVKEVEEALLLKIKFPHILLCGERNSVKINGFDYDNSPLNFYNNNVKGRELVFTTTNGTNAILSCKTDVIAICSMINVGAVSKKAKIFNNDINIVMAGTRGHFSLDDALVAGAVIFKLKEYAVLDDMAKICLSYYENKMNDLGVGIRECINCMDLIELGFEDDVNFSIQYDITSIVPQLVDEKIIIL